MRRVITELERDAPEHWTGYVEILRGITTQSVATALRMTGGVSEAANYLAPRIEATPLVKSPLFLLNASHDALMAETYASGTFRFGPDRRASILIQPLLLKSKNLSSALEFVEQRRIRRRPPTILVHSSSAGRIGVCDRHANNPSPLRKKYL